MLAETIEALLELLQDRFGRNVRLEAVTQFDLGRAFGLTPVQLEAFMDAANEPKFLESFGTVKGARETLEHWVEAGYRIEVMTGRPPKTRVASERWLAREGLLFHSFQTVDKYGRNSELDGAISLESLTAMSFSLAIEDSLEVAAFLAGTVGTAVALLDRPWNRETGSLSAEARVRITRVSDWADIRETFSEP